MCNRGHGRAKHSRPHRQMPRISRSRLLRARPPCAWRRPTPRRNGLFGPPSNGLKLQIRLTKEQPPDDQPQKNPRRPRSPGAFAERDGCCLRHAAKNMFRRLPHPPPGTICVRGTRLRPAQAPTPPERRRTGDGSGLGQRKPFHSHRLPCNRQAPLRGHVDLARHDRRDHSR